MWFGRCVVTTVVRPAAERQTAQPERPASTVHRSACSCSCTPSDSESDGARRCNVRAYVDSLSLTSPSPLHCSADSHTAQRRRSQRTRCNGALAERTVQQQRRHMQLPATALRLHPPHQRLLPPLSPPLRPPCGAARTRCCGAFSPSDRCTRCRDFSQRRRGTIRYRRRCVQVTQ